MTEETKLRIKGIRIDASVLRTARIQRCALVECQAACCTGGVWLDAEHMPRILEYREAVRRFLPPDRHDETKWFSEPEDDADFPSGRCTGTNVVDDPQRPGQTCCVFLRHDRRCALQVTSNALDLGWPALKPFYCALYPLYLEGDELSVDDETPLDFVGGGCQQPAPDMRPVYQIYREEATLILGEDGYRELSERAASR
jgi:Fe-S-cluster containining protein